MENCPESLPVARSNWAKARLFTQLWEEENERMPMNPLSTPWIGTDEDNIAYQSSSSLHNAPGNKWKGKACHRRDE